MELAGRRVLVVGLGRSGQAAARFLARRGAAVTGNDLSPALPPGVEAALAACGVRLVLGGHDPALFAAAELIVLSPGVPPLPALEAATRAGVPVWSELELGARALEVPIAAVTGTNGKSTTTELLGAICREAGLRVFVGGNLGVPLVEAADQGPFDLAVVEVSSFQLERIVTFRPRVAGILNITEDHLDRYPGMDEYVAAKARIFENMRAGDDLVLNADDPRVAALARRVRPHVRITWVSPQGGAGAEARAEPGALVFAPGGGEGPVERYPLERVRLTGRHNVENMLVALAMARRLSVEPAAIQRALERFAGLAHRIERIAEVAGVAFYDDSKATNVAAVARALESFATPVILIAGGKDKGGDYGPLAPLVRERVKRLVLIGEAAPRLREALGGLVETVCAPSLPAAVELAFAAARPGDSVLLSPACSSFDMFRDYLHRSAVFAEAVRALAARLAQPAPAGPTAREPSGSAGAEGRA
ncbi:MAG TPA: UDP-N-acetylmuramoyl-L-alanine--D-glutamate ligase [Thermodesulfobacteriota bacterium]|nr:UDP-N-acetylmuramoyl-L-alanine--D-glutamate ligase [Thermodesulfobacteriota bacterium]